MEAKEKYMAGLTVKALVVGSILVAVINYLFANTVLIKFYHWFPTWGQANYNFQTYGLITLVIFIIALINLAKPVFSRQELSIITIMMAIGSFFLFIRPTEKYPSPHLWLLYTYPALKLFYPDYYQYWPSITGPDLPTSKITEILTTSVPPDLGPWMGPMIIAIFWFLTQFFCFIFLSLLLRQLFVNIEVLAFPLAGVHNDLIELTQSENGKSGIARGKWFWIGFIIQFLVGLPYLSFVVGPVAEPNPPTSIGGFPLVWEYDVTPLGLLPWVPIVLVGWLWAIGFALLVPLESLHGYVLGWLIFVVIMPIIFTSLGWLPPMGTGVSGWGCLTRMLEGPSQFSGYYMTVSLGILIGIALFPLWLARDHVMRVLKGIAQKQPELDATSPMPYPLVWAGFIISFILMVAAWIIIGIPAQVALICSIILVILHIGSARFAGAFGGWLGQVQGVNVHPVLVATMLAAVGLFPAIITEQSIAATVTSDFFCAGGPAYMLPVWTGAMVALPLVGFKLGEMTKTRVKDMFKAICIAVIIAVIISTFSSVIQLYAFSAPEGTPIYSGFRDIGGWANTHTQVTPDRVRAARRTSPPGGEARYEAAMTWLGMGTSIIFGLIVTVAAYLMRITFPGWFRIDPVGFFPAVVFNAGDDPSWWFPVMLAWIVKWIAVKFIGVRRFDEKIRPIGTGLFIGYCFISIIWTIFAMLHNLGIYGNFYA